MTYNNNQEIEEYQEEDEISFVRNDEKWAIRDIGSAHWADGVIYEAEMSIENKNKIADATIATLKKKIEAQEKWKIDSTKKEVSDIEFFSNHLRVYHMNLIDSEKAANAILVKKDKKPKKLSLTIKLPYRDLTCRTQQATIMVNGKKMDDSKGDPELVGFVKENYPDLIKEEVKWGDFKKKLVIKEHNGEKVYLAEEFGLVVDCIKLADNPDKYDYKVKKDSEE